jgi:tetraprenyl-beta-curcumene synthase
LFRDVLPIARDEIKRWTSLALRIPDPVLRTQALQSLKFKRFHADGGCVYAAVNPTFTAPLVRLIVALQTISDYLDNLCDRCDSYDGDDFALLHNAMREAVRPFAPLSNYYEKRGNVDDGGYLQSLVTACQTELRTLSGYATVQPYVEWLVERYSELQVYKHIEPEQRTRLLMEWWEDYKHDYPDLHWWEFAAASGSTLGMFAMFLAATKPVDEKTAERLFQTYFPWIGGLHILLDYLIDLDEDDVAGDYNFVQCYAEKQYARERIGWFVTESERHVDALVPQPRIHRDVIQGLLGMYLSDGKVGKQAEVKQTRRLVLRSGPLAWMYFGACVLYRKIR